MVKPSIITWKQHAEELEQRIKKLEELLRRIVMKNGWVDAADFRDIKALLKEDS